MEGSNPPAPEYTDDWRISNFFHSIKCFIQYHTDALLYQFYLFRSIRNVYIIAFSLTDHLNVGQFSSFSVTERYALVEARSVAWQREGESWTSGRLCLYVTSVVADVNNDSLL